MLNSNTLNTQILDGTSPILGSAGTSELCTINVSDYKWLTSTLKTSQQAAAVRPYFDCYIKDDKVLPNSIISSSTYPIDGSITTAPDSRIIAAGKDYGGNISFWYIIDPSQVSQWNSPTAIIDNGSGYTSVLGTTISVSEYINDIYHIDIYILVIVSSLYKVVHYYSDDGGTTWLPDSENPISLVTASTGYAYIAAGKPYQDINGVVQSVFFNTDSYIINSWNNLSGSWVNNTWTDTVDTGDWNIHSLDSYYDGNSYYVVFSGYHQYIESSNNYSLYLTSVSDKDSLNRNIWSIPRDILLSLSSSTYNQNNYTLPRVNYDSLNEQWWLTFNAKIVTYVTTQTSAGGSTPVNTSVVYYSCRTKDGINFTYPYQVTMADGSILTDDKAYNFSRSNLSFFLAGNGQVWEFLQGYAIADVSQDVISVQLKESAGGVNSISLIVGNQNGQWIGPSPTGLFAEAIAKDRKILLDLGYYNSNGIPEVAPRNIFYIDDIQQNVTANTNDLTIAGRDYNKGLRTTISRFSYNFIGPSSISDIFDGTTTSNWNQSSGMWIQNATNYKNTWTTVQSNTGNIGSWDSNLEYTLLYRSQFLSKFNSVLCTNINLQYVFSGNSSVYIIMYAFYQDKDNWLRIRFYGGTNPNAYWIIEKSVAGSVTGLNSGTFTSTGNAPYPIIVKKFGYVYNFMSGENYSITGNGVYSFNPSATFVDFGNYDLTTEFSNGSFNTGTVGFASNNCAPKFSYFKYFQYSNSQNIGELTKTISTKSSIFDYDVQEIFDDKLFDSSLYTGIFNIINRELIIDPAQSAIKNDATISNGEIEFEAKLSPTNSSLNYGLDIIFRSSVVNFDNCYIWNIDKRTPSGPLISSRFKINSTSPAIPTLLLSSSSNIDYTPSSTFADLVIDLTQWHKYKLIMSDGFISGYIDDRLVISWNDNNTDINYSSGYVGFSSNSNTTSYIRNIRSSVFWNQVENFSINPGDDMETSVGNSIGILKGWQFSNQFGKMSLKVLNSTDNSNYIYEDVIQKQETDNSDKEYISQITVYGNGVSAVAQDTSLIASSGIVRESIISDYKILTYQDVLNRAKYELNNANKFNNQSQPTVQLNVGSEVLDVITVVNVGDNSSNVDTNLRVYNQNISIGGGKTGTNYTLNIETGDL